MKPLGLALLMLVLGPSFLDLEAQPFTDVRILTEDSPPGEVLGADGRVTGPTAEFVRELGRRLGVVKEMEMLPWTRAYDLALKEKQIAIFETTRTEQREPLFHWIGPIKRIQWQFWAKKSSKFRPKTLDDVKKLGLVAVYLGDSKTDFLESAGFTNLNKVSAGDLAARQLNAGRVATWMASDLGMKEIFDRAGLPMDDFEPIYTVETKYLYVALSLDFTPTQVKAWRDALEAMKREGLLARYYEGTYDPSMIRDLSRPGDPLGR